MAHGNRPQLAEIFPDDENGTITVENERHRYEVFEGDNNTKLPKYEYTLDKAPIIEVKEVTGISGGESKTFVKGSDYALNPLVSEREDTFTFNENESQYTLSTVPDDNSSSVEDASGNTYAEGTDYEIVEVNGDQNVLDWSAYSGSTPDDDEDFTVSYEVTFQKGIIDWDQGGDTPDAGTFFEVTYTAQSIISRYLDADEDELNSVEDELDRIIEGKFIDQASGEELDRIGRTFGRIGKREGRSDTQYRIYLKSVVQSFISRGTKNSIKTAVSAATDVPMEDITINENFQKSEYEVQVVAATPITGSVLEEVAEIADPSGVTQSRTRFTIPPETTGIQDTVDTTQGINVGIDFMGADDSFQIDPNKTDAGVHAVGADDAAASIRRAGSETAYANDAVAVNPNTVTANETSFSNDTNTVSTTTVAWDHGNWDSMNWAREHN